MDHRRRARVVLGATLGVPLVAVLVATLVAASTAMIPTRAAAQCDPPPGDAFAFLSLASQSCPATPLVHWSPPGVTVDCSFFADGTHDVSCGESTAAACVQHCRGAVATWNTDLAERFFFAEADAAHPVAFCDSADGRTSIGGSTRVCGGQVFGPNIIAVTLRVTITDGPERGEQLDADIVLNPSFNSLFTAGFFRAVIEHELGHVLGLDHPDECGRDANVLMRSAFRFADGDPCFVSAPTADDVNGATMIYPLLNPGPTPTPGPLCGDVNGDGAVGVSDVAAVLQAAVDLPSTCDALPVRCDVNAADGVDVIDAANVQRRALGLSSANACAF